MEDLPSSRFTWTIENFLRVMNIKKHYSKIFIVGGYKWRVLLFPKGNNVDHLSMYLDVADSGSFPYGRSRYAQYSLAVINQVHSKYTIRKDTQHQFNSRESDWGFTSFMPLSDLYDPSRGYLVNDTVVVEAEVVVHKVVDYWTYDSKKETGYVGLKNQGTTCYMNSLLQTLYHIPYFRKAVYHMPTTENDIPSGSIHLALQSLFFRLQYSDNSVATKELTKSFGWDTDDSFIQHDVQELNMVLCERLEDKMKGTVAEGTIQQLFEGHHMNYIECINVDYKSSPKESFYDLQLDVKGCRDVYASFDKYVEVVRLEGDKKYHTEQYGLQDAKKGALFIDFPPVLQLQLKRFKYDFMRDTMVKINDRYEFPLQLDLDRDNGKYLSPDADRSIRNLYTLHSVLVHSGGVHGGHYYAFIRPILSDQWFKFDDERVTKEEMKRALEEQYGGEEELQQSNPGFNNTPFKLPKYSNAYMLVYIRESDKDKIICSVDEKDIAKHLRIILKKEQEEKEHKEKAEAHLYTIIKVARDEDLTGQIGKDIYFDLVDHDKVRNFRIKKQMPFKAFKEEVAKELGIPVQFQRFWLWAKRKNHTYRPNRPLSPLEEAQSVGQLTEVSNKEHNAKLNLFLEVELGVSRPFFPPAKTKDDILLFFKLFDPVKEELRYVGRLFVKALGNPAEIITKLNEMAGFSPNEEIELYKEIKFEPSVMCEHIDKKLNFRSSQLEDGDIICYQKCPYCSNDQCHYPDVPSFLEYVHNRQLAFDGRNDQSPNRLITQIFRKQKSKSRLAAPITTTPPSTTPAAPAPSAFAPSYHSPNHQHTPYLPYTSFPRPPFTYPTHPHHPYYSTPPPRPIYPQPTYSQPTYPQSTYPQPPYTQPTYPQPTTIPPPVTTMPPPHGERPSQDMRRFIEPEGDAFNPPTQAINCIRDIIKGNYNAPYISWTKIPLEVRDMWFREFKRNYYWLPQHHDKIRQNFEHRGATRFKDIFMDLRKSRTRPMWIGEGDWASLCATWDNPEYDKMGERNKQNRALDCGGLGTSLHADGSVPLTEHRGRLKNMLGREFTISEIHSRTHQRQETQQWVDPRAQRMNEYLRMNEQYSQSSGAEESYSDASSQSSDFMLWSKAVVGKKNGKTYELGAQSYAFEAQSSYTSSDYTDQTVHDVLRKQDELMTRLSQLETQQQQHQQQDMMRQMMQQMIQLQQEVARLLAQQQHRHEDETDYANDDD